ncbi:hypothetical protein [Conexibacter sp. CPCC 206217]|uniref:hypothetical protein n=1 Tax=Conexibacter sp. CPCC 206217 TaxID=3064574 RepID=UPI00271EBC88|nr:hypothetical protein [Conexibacter sp. CPCC 206217]MDO8209995.1 hypothetical protein [Conexibacter sp. CPCC 206217]
MTSPDASPTLPRRTTPRPDAATLAAVALLTLGALFLLYASRHMTFFSDDWSFIETRRAISADALLESHNGHMTLVPVVIYQLLFAIFGLSSYLPYLVVLIALHVTACASVFVLARRYVGGVAALVPMVLLLFLGAAYEDLLWAFQITLVGSTAFGLLGLVLLGREGRRSDVGAAIALFASVACSGVGVAFLAGAAVELLLRRDWRRLWVAGIPIFLYLCWYVGYGGDQEKATAANLANAPQYVSDAAAGAAAAIGGLTYNWGAPLLLFGILAVWVARRAQLDPRELGPRFAALLTVALVNWGLTALTRGQLNDPAGSRYLYAGSALLLVLAVAPLRPPRRDVRLAAAALVLTGAAVLSNVGALRDGQRLWRGYADQVKAAVTALDVAGRTAPADLRPVLGYSPQIVSGEYLDAVDDIGSSPGFSPAELLTATAATRASVDATLTGVAAAGIRPLPRGERASAGGTAPTVDDAAGGDARVRGACVRFTPSAAGATLQLSAAPGETLTFRPAARGAAVPLWLRRYGDEFPTDPVTSLAPGVVTEVALPRDTQPQQVWRLRVVPARPLVACRD